MIAFINGRLDSIDEEYVYIDCNGVGYAICMPASDIAEVGEIGDSVKVYTHMHVTENDMSLFGFNSLKGKELFEMLITVSGIGPKAGIAILSELTVDETYKALATGDSASISRAKGVGKKTAERAILELGSKIDNELLVDVQSVAVNDISYKNEIVMALQSLGYSKSEANTAIQKVEYKDGMTEEEFLKECLKYMI